MKLAGDTLLPANVTVKCDVTIPLELKNAGWYKIDLAHPVVNEDSMPSITFKINKSKLSVRFRRKKGQQEGDRAISSLGATYLTPGKYQINIGGKFFVGFSHIAFTPLPDNSQLVQSMTKERSYNEKKYAGHNPSLRPFIGTRLDDGMDYKAFGQPQDITNTRDNMQEYVFTGQLENLPVPTIKIDEQGIAVYKKK